MTPRDRINWPKALAWAVMLLLCAAFWAWVGVSVAKAAPPKEVRAPLYHGDVSVQEEFDRTAAWLSRVLRAEIPSRPVEVTEDLHFPVNEAEFYPSGLIKARPAVETALAFREGVTIGGKRYAPGAHILVHESLHREATVACWWPETGLNIEEGIVDALAADLVPAWGWHFWRERLFVFPRYPVEVAALRAASARATGAKTWRERAPREWRRKLWAASCEGRVAMLSEVR